MTIEQDAGAPQSRDVDTTTASSVDAAVQQPFPLLAALVEKANAAERRSAELAERVALLEDGRRKDEAARRPSLVSLRGLGSTRISFARRKEEPEQWEPSARPDIQDAEEGHAVGRDEGCLPCLIAQAEGIPEKRETRDVEPALADRVTFLERQLEAHEEEKGVIPDPSRRAISLPESTFSLLITHDVRSVPFAFAVISIAISFSCLALTLASSIQKGVSDNRLGIPAGVNPEVRAAQFLGAIVGVLMEDEIPQGLQLISNGAGNTLLLNGRREVQKRVVVCSILRLVVGYLFLSSLFINVAQNADVISIFYDVLALEFVENIDDTAFALAKRGFFGRAMLFAANQKNDLEIPNERRHSVTTHDASITASERRASFSGLIVSRNRMDHLVRFVYFLNAAIVLAGMGYITATQRNGAYRCNSISLTFGEEAWENAIVRLPQGGYEERLLIYSAFNGDYQEEGSHDGYPRYVERNKINGEPFLSSARKGAEIVYCRAIDSWVLRHPDIVTSASEDEAEQNECSWLWRSGQTSEYDLLSTNDGSWTAWVGEVKPLAEISIACNECAERSHCNYRGRCEDGVCLCDPTHFGHSCEFERPCGSLGSEKAQQFDSATGMHWHQENPIQLWGDNGADSHTVYGRPVYIQSGLSGDPYDMRLYKILEETSPSPSNQPSSAPSGSVLLSKLPELPEETEPERPLHIQNRYDTAPDFEDLDDFFERQHLHGLEEILEDYNVMISYSGSRFYGTIIEPDRTMEDLFPLDYHAFWSESFDPHRTFVISDVTVGGSPVGIDFFEMRRRINSVLNPQVRFSYGPFGALIPLMDFQGTGFFHCLEGELHPSSSPSLISAAPSEVPTTTMLPSQTPSANPSGSCIPVDIIIDNNDFRSSISWKVIKMDNDKNGSTASNLPVEVSEEILEPHFQISRGICLFEGHYVFAIEDLFNSGIRGYKLESGQERIHGNGVEKIRFSIPMK